jgi:hypothetical protein
MGVCRFVPLKMHKTRGNRGRNPGFLGLEKMRAEQVIDFSPVANIFHLISPIFHPLFQLQAVDVLPVVKNTRA